MPRTIAEAAAAVAAGGPPPPPLAAILPRCVTSPGGPPTQLYMKTDAESSLKTQSLFYHPDGTLAFRIVNHEGFFEKKEVYDGAGGLLLRCSKLLLSRAKWTITSPEGKVLAKTRTISGLAKIGLEVLLPSRGDRPAFIAMPAMNDLSSMCMWQQGAKGRPEEEAPLCQATYGDTVALGVISALVQNWSYYIDLAPGADAALVVTLLAIYTDLAAWNAAGAYFGMN